MTDPDDLEREILLEQEMINGGVARYKKGIARAKAGLNPVTGKVQAPLESNTSYGLGIMKSYVADVALQIKKDIAKWKGKPGRKPAAWAYLSKLDHETSAYITCKAILDNISGVTPLVTMVNRIAGKIEDQARLDIFQMQDKKYFQATTKYMDNTLEAKGYTNKRLAYVRAAKRAESKIRPWNPWCQNDKVHIGNALLEAFIKVTSDYSEDGQRILGTGIVEKVITRLGRKTKYYIQGTPKATEWIHANQDVCQYFTPDFMPTLVEPVDWTSPTNGGYHVEELRKRKPLVKMQQRKFLKAMARRGVYKQLKFYQTVNSLQATPWTINSFVYQQMILEFNAEHGADMPSRVETIKPEAPSFFCDPAGMTEKEFKEAKKESKDNWTDEDKAEYVEWTIKMKKYTMAENDRLAEIINVSRTINTANRFRYEDKFYFVWTADFRSRLYPCGTALSPQGTDKSKALIKFYNGVALGEDGFNHLCIHAAGVYGYDKVSLNDRVAWVHQNKELIIETANNPGSTREFWMGADKPYSFLAVCEEIAECIQLDTKAQQAYISFIPCAQDGSCNGIQHYSAMLRDPVGASAVNLMDSEVPSDIYMECADKVIDYIHRTIDDDVEFDGQDWIPASDYALELAKGWLEFGIARDCTKKPTMVIPYGGTKIGCRDTCRDYLEKYTKKYKEGNKDYENPFTKIDTSTSEGANKDPEVVAITWLHHLVWHALDEVVVSARTAMKFLKDCTKAIVHGTEDGCMMSWTTPTGFRVYSEIKKTKLYSVDSHLEGRIQLWLQKDIPEIDTRKMQTSIAPNFVHSLDSSHLQKTVCLANEMGIRDIACVHDSFGTHAGHCTVLHNVIRYSFVGLHKNNVLLRFWQEQVANDRSVIGNMPNVDDVDQGEFDLDHVLNSTHFFR